MKNLFFLIGLCVLLFGGCEKDSVVVQDSNTDTVISAQDLLETRSNGQMVPLKGEIIEVGVGPSVCNGVPYFTHYDDISGHLTHLGNVEGGYADLFNCRIELRDGVPFVVVDDTGVFQAANGDVVNYEGSVWVSTLDFSFGNVQFITGGTGRWEGAEGDFVLSGESLPDGTLLMVVDGQITPPNNP
jgi:hypothetical protein